MHSTLYKYIKGKHFRNSIDNLLGDHFFSQFALIFMLLYLQT